MSYLPLLTMIQRRSDALTARAEVTAKLAATGESSSANIELSLIEEEAEFLTRLGREVLSQQRARVEQLRAETPTGPLTD